MINRNLSENRRAKKNSGITLIALVVTIVVLIILATVSILAVFGDNGIIARAQKAKNMYQNSQNAEDEAMKEVLNVMPKQNTNEGTVTYYIDTNNIQKQSFIYGVSVLNPSFTPTKDDYTFMGWKEDNLAGGNVITKKTMQNKEITLYAVFGKKVIVSYDANGGESIPPVQTDYIYYNNGNELYPTFTLPEAISRSGYNFKSWNLGSLEGTAYESKSSITLSNSTTFYANWQSQYAEVKNAYVSGWCLLTGSDGTNIWPYSPNNKFGNYTRSTIASNGCISWYKNYFKFKANTNCKVTIRTSISAQPADGDTWYSYWCAVYIDNSQKTVLYNGGVSGNCDTAATSISKSYTINLTAGQICDFRFRGGHDQDTGDRSSYSGVCYVTATPI